MAMDRMDYIIGLLGCSKLEFEDLILQNYLQWCSDKCYTAAPIKFNPNADALHLELNIQDLQSLMADAALFKYFIKLYIDVMLDFIEDVQGMKPQPNANESRHMFNLCVGNIYRYFNTDLMTAARNKKIVEYVKN
jgi:hypothetical protein